MDEDWVSEQVSVSDIREADVYLLTYVVSFDLCGFLLLTLSFPCGK
jgi:hypothetical protein